MDTVVPKQRAYIATDKRKNIQQSLKSVSYRRKKKVVISDEWRNGSMEKRGNEESKIEKE